MLTILFRTVAVYATLIVIMRIMGKRQIGELELTDLVTTLLVSEIASLPVTNPEIPLLHALVPMLILLILEVFSSVILLFFPRLKNLVSARPTVIIHNGRLCQSALRQIRLSLDELMSEVRQQGLTDLSQVEAAILEKNGNLTVIPKPAYAPPTAKDLGVSPPDEGLMHIVYSNNTYSKSGLALIGRDRAWLERQLAHRSLDPRTLFCVTANKKGTLYWIPKEKKK
ncbi:MAG: DUF421 domain-containing protein [Ruminococcaceae bacterium]|nr:DUF421 domain-containing protein [Oscillospiraceae bacterium]